MIVVFQKYMSLIGRSNILEWLLPISAGRRELDILEGRSFSVWLFSSAVITVTEGTIWNKNRKTHPQSVFFLFLSQFGGIGIVVR